MVSKADISSDELNCPTPKKSQLRRTINWKTGDHQQVGELLDLLRRNLKTTSGLMQSLRHVVNTRKQYSRLFKWLHKISVCGSDWVRGLGSPGRWGILSFSTQGVFLILREPVFREL
ncbi:hypothetical protein RRG08_054650 [Elysia crispata]|uniref:Uncharacterized protein n=1 Tax=Elysia crispata TaxID=231223 RepID=A0AAE1E7V4_9GAST|nr:hypothetical protein RRG08_054650 [Elysia crispata]